MVKDVDTVNNLERKSQVSLHEKLENCSLIFQITLRKTGGKNRLQSDNFGERVEPSSPGRDARQAWHEV